MPSKPAKELIHVTEGTVIGEMVVGPLLPHDDPRRMVIPNSYLVHGRIRICYCSCGKDAFYSEFALSRGRLKSCGHLKFAETMRIERNREINSKIKELRGIINIQKVHYARARQLGNTAAETSFMASIQDLYSQISSLRLRLV